MHRISLYTKFRFFLVTYKARSKMKRRKYVSSWKYESLQEIGNVEYFYTDSQNNYCVFLVFIFSFVLGLLHRMQFQIDKGKKLQGLTPEKDCFGQFYGILCRCYDKKSMVLFITLSIILKFCTISVDNILTDKLPELL